MKILFFLFMSIFMFAASPQKATAQSDYAGYLTAKDTLTNADTVTYEVAITGTKHSVSFQTNIIKLTGTVSGSVSIFGSVDGSTYLTTALSTDTLLNATNNYGYSYSFNGYKKYKLQVITTGTGTASQRSYVMYRK